MVKIADRISWAVEVVDVAANENVLEIGCGNGAAVYLIGKSLDEGKITAIDRSEKMIHSAEKNNAGLVSLGRASFHIASLDSLNEISLAPGLYNKIFAINVNLFWLEADCGLNIIRDRLLPGGMVYLFNQPPAASKLQDIADRTCSNLQSAGFTIKQIIYNERLPVPGVCVIAGV